ncbi:Calx-beta domain-containing protein, partial [Undibacterium sp. Ji22W]|uniref:Calx-beta domain-containing protein n=1 Tax=Undibacterium sp. Ji22W TaxID=3413038 RepID=UPI003BF0E2E6
DSSGNAVSVPVGSSVAVALNWSGVATAGVDTSALPASVNVSGGSSTTFTVTATDDVLKEDTESLIATISGVIDTNSSFEDVAIGSVNVASSAITDNDATPSLSINDVIVNEAAGTATFTVTLSAASGQTVSVGYNTSNGTATAGSDYTATSGTLTFNPGVTTQTITVNIANDSVFELSEN